MEIKFCLFCGNEYQGNNNQKYCSYNCFLNTRRTKLICEKCEKHFIRCNSRINENTKFCSKSCSKSFTAIKNKYCVGRILSEETKRKIGIKQIGRKPNIEERKKKSISAKNMWLKHKKSGYLKKVIEEMKNGKALQMRLKAKTRFSDTSIERKVENYLLFNEILYVKQFNTGVSIADFWLPESNLIIECDGDYWHNLPKNKERNTKQNILLEKNDYNLLRLSEHDINNNFNTCIERIIESNV